MSLFIIEDHPLYREALAALIKRIKPGETVVELDRIGGIPAAVQQHGAPDAVCLDLTLSDSLGISGIREIKHHYPNAVLIVISEQSFEEVGNRCMEAGAATYLCKQTPSKDILLRMRALLLPEDAQEKEKFSSGRLSKRQIQLLAAIDKGLSNRDIADQLGISEHTVKVHLWRLFRRLDVKSRTQAIHVARAHGMIRE